jgi:glutamyl-tRNA synthetase
MHLGNLFSALLAWLSVRAADGELLLRIEDLDPDRCRPAYAAALKDDLRWLGLSWDREGQQQSQRSGEYARQFAKLEQAGLVYPCYCSRTELHAASAPHASDGRVLYAGTCRSLTPAQRAEKTKKPAWRLLVPDKTYGFIDGLQGPYQENLATECGDFIIRRADGVYAYQLAVVTDDALMGVTQVVRGRDLLDSTPRQLYLYERLGLTPPDFYHVPLLLAADGRRLSKRERDLDMESLRQHTTPEQIIGLLAHLAGLQPDPTPVTAGELAKTFSWDQVRREDVVVQPEHLHLLLE